MTARVAGDLTPCDTMVVRAPYEVQRERPRCELGRGLDAGQTTRHRSMGSIP